MKQNKCPSCGLVNFADARQCKRCNLRLSDLSGRDVRRGGAARSGRPQPGLFVVTFLLVLAALGSTYMYTRRPDAVGAPDAEAQEADAAPAARRAKSGPPPLSGRRPGGPPVPGDLLGSVERNNEERAERMREYRRAMDETIRRVGEQTAEKNRQREERQAKQAEILERLRPPTPGLSNYR